ncbi:ERF family protein [Pseudomonas nicosulfuronedens]|uniref:ERF family protein n=1 Tax=Pseudomonas nicosulfuronedens TaxID=2571105 RepID=UPI00244B2F82|nr:ERF family protein [Pseudomonas nicosulfuronedens]MDH1009970.1 ERF family protein [Pseudomonas nicosulfuronedens]MDH1978946.1 ERF family protein [Pseudomonas nicosulfuronedens]MDH2028375.1 ERF family protein [Pseudomonas nicosulfuronedens]
MDDTILIYRATYGTPEQVAQLYAAFAKAQGAFEPIAKNREVEIPIKDKQTGARISSYKFRYADLEEINSKTRKPLSENGLGTMQSIGRSTTTTGTSIFTRLTHAGGACIEDEIPLPSQEKRDIKDYGATVSYLRRYAKTALLDIAADDDLDANGDRDDEPPAGSQPEQQPDSTGKPPYPDEKLQKMLPQWQKLITSGKKTADQVIATVCSGNTLTPQQVETIRGLATEGATS